MLGDVGGGHLHLQLAGGFLAFPRALSLGEVAGLNGHRAGGDDNAEPRAFLASPRWQGGELAGSVSDQVRFRELRRPDVPDCRRVIRYGLKITARFGICNKPSHRGAHRAGAREARVKLGKRGSGARAPPLAFGRAARQEEGVMMCT